MEYNVLKKIIGTNKTMCGIPGDLPRKLVTELFTELATPMCKKFNTAINSAKQGAVKWPTP